MHKIIVATS